MTSSRLVVPYLPPDANGECAVVPISTFYNGHLAPEERPCARVLLVRMPVWCGAVIVAVAIVVMTVGVRHDSAECYK